MKIEVWEDIKDYEGIYQVSNVGNVKSLDRYRISGNGGYIQKGKIIKNELCTGYNRVSLCKLGKINRTQVHRLVGQTFIPNLENKPFINHINGIKTDNRVENLEWCTSSENQLHKFRVLGYKNKNRKIINQYDLQGNFIKQYPSITDAAKSLGISDSNLSYCCKGIYKTIKGFKWSYNKIN